MDRKAFKSKFPEIASGLPDADLDALIGALKVRALVQGDTLVREGDPAHCAWLVFEGTLGVTVGLARRTVSLGRITAGSMVGEISFVDGGAATATITAQGSVTVLELSADSVDALLATNPKAASALNRAACDALSQHLRAATDKLQSLRAGLPGQTTMDHIEGESLLDALRELLGLGRK